MLPYTHLYIKPLRYFTIHSYACTYPPLIQVYYLHPTPLTPSTSFHTLSRDPQNTMFNFRFHSHAFYTNYLIANIRSTHLLSYRNVTFPCSSTTKSSMINLTLQLFFLNYYIIITQYKYKGTLSALLQSSCTHTLISLHISNIHDKANSPYFLPFFPCTPFISSYQKY